MFRKKPIAAAISSLTAATMLSTGAYAADEERIEEVTVTGSRIPQSVSDAPRPITVVSRDEIDLSGMENVADVLRTTTYNSFGSFRERSGSSFQQVALVGLRGLGEDRTAVLINGRRVPGNPLTGSSAVDLNSIPLSAVERIELLTDSASAIYGADAIGGVINIIMEDDFEGFDVEIGTEMPTREGAESDHVSFTWGASGDKGNVLFSGEWFRRDPVFDGDRAYSSVQITGSGVPRHGVDTVGVSSGGNTMFELDFSNAFPASDNCPTPPYIPLAEPEGISGATGCGFGYADLSMQTGGIDRKSTFLNANYEVNEDHRAYFESRLTSSKTFGRYAPAVGFFFVDDEAPLNPTLGTPEQRGLFLFHRLIAHGNRNDNAEVLELDNVGGFTGTLFDGAVNYDAYARFYQYDATIEGDTYVIASIIEGLVADGSYNFLNPTDPSNADAVRQSAATLLRDISTEYTAAGISFDGFAFDLPAGQIGWAAGAEIASEEYQDQYDNLREAGNVLGSAGNSSAGDRSRWAVFGEFSVPVTDNFEITGAGRYDDYDDFGTEFSPSIALRYQPIEQLVLRASWGEGFKAPNLGDLYQELSSSFETITDLTRCTAQGISEANCPNSQVEEYTGGNPDLQAEQSESLNLGVVFEPLANVDLSLSADWYNIELEGAVDTLDLQDVIDLEMANGLPPGVIVNRGPAVGGVPGIVSRCEGSSLSPPACGLINVFGNLAGVEVEGLDIRAHYSTDLDIGTLTFDVEWSHVLAFDEQPLPGGQTFDRPGTEGFPENRINFTASWRNGSFGVNYLYRFIDEMDGVTAGSKYEDFTTHDLTATWDTPYDSTVTVGVMNLTDEDPSIDNVSGWDDEVSLLLYSVAGRVPFLTYQHRF